MLYLIMPDRFANGNPKTIAMLLQRKKYNRDLPGGRHGGDIQGIIKITSPLLEQQRSGAHRYVKIMTKPTPITPMLNLMFIN
jgi:hypothetical protein